MISVLASFYQGLSIVSESSLVISFDHMKSHCEFRTFLSAQKQFVKVCDISWQLPP